MRKKDAAAIAAGVTAVAAAGAVIVGIVGRNKPNGTTQPEVTHHDADYYFSGVKRGQAAPGVPAQASA